MKSIKKLNISFEVANAFINAINEGGFKPDDRLLPMKELCDQLQAGISSVRE